MGYVSKIYFRFSGRIPRSIYWLASIPIALLAFVAKINDEQDWTVVLWLVILWPALAISTKRCHDLDKSGWWNLINFVPVIGSFWFLIECGFWPGTHGPNRFGEDPLQEENS